MLSYSSVFKSPNGQLKYLDAYDASLRLWPTSYESFDVTSEYGRTHINACGPKEGFPVVLLHAGYACSTMWFPNVGDLSKTFRVLAFDTIGEPGKSLPARLKATKLDCAKWLVSVFDNLGISKAHVVGLSRGGWLSLNLGIHAPQRVEKIVLLSPAASFISLNAFFRIVSSAAMHIPAPAVAKAAINSWVTKGFKINEIYAEQFILGLLNYNWRIATKGYSGVMPSAFSEDDLHQIHLPVLMLIGDHDRLNPPKSVERVRQMITHIETDIILNAGHLLAMEQPDLVDKRILEFLQ
jgi:pimeloyl-ACP methyl ester carboxylesterase